MMQTGTSGQVHETSTLGSWVAVCMGMGVPMGMGFSWITTRMGIGFE